MTVSLIPYKTLSQRTIYVLSTDGVTPVADPPGPGGNAIQDNFVAIADLLDSLVGHDHDGQYQPLGVYLTEEADPVFSASVAAGITLADVAAWNTAYGWGDHAAAGYAASDHNHAGVYDPAGSGAAARAAHEAAYNHASYDDLKLTVDFLGESYGNHAISVGTAVHGLGNSSTLNVGTSAGTVAAGNHDHDGVYLTSETDPVFGASVASTITSTLVAYWNSAYAWGNHATAGYALAANVVPYSGATADLALGTRAVTTTGLITGGHLKDSSLTTGRVPVVTTGGQLIDYSTFLYDAAYGILSVGGATMGLNLAAPSQYKRLTSYHIPRLPDPYLIDKDYLDEAFYMVERGATLTVSPAASSGTAADIFKDDTNFLQWSAGTSPSPITIELDCSAVPVTAKNNATYTVGLVFRSSAANANPTHIKIEAWNGSAYSTVYDADVTTLYSYDCWISPAFTSPKAPSYSIDKLKITLTVTNPLPTNFRVQRVLLYHMSADYDPWHLHVRGGSLLGDLALPADKAFYLGPATIDGSWRIVRSGNNLVIQRRESAVWVTKSTISA